MKHQRPTWGARINGFRERAQPHLPGVQGLNGVEQLAQRAGQAVEFPDDERVVRAHIVESGMELRAVALGATRFLGIDTRAPRRLEGIELQGEVLILGGYTGITDGHGHGGPLSTRVGLSELSVTVAN